MQRITTSGSCREGSAQRRLYTSTSAAVTPSLKSAAAASPAKAATTPRNITAPAVSSSLKAHCPASGSYRGAGPPPLMAGSIRSVAEGCNPLAAAVPLSQLEHLEARLLIEVNRLESRLEAAHEGVVAKVLSVMELQAKTLKETMSLEVKESSVALEDQLLQVITFQVKEGTRGLEEQVQDITCSMDKFATDWNTRVESVHGCLEDFATGWNKRLETMQGRLEDAAASDAELRALISELANITELANSTKPFPKNLQKKAALEPVQQLSARLQQEAKDMNLRVQVLEMLLPRQSQSTKNDEEIDSGLSLHDGRPVAGIDVTISEISIQSLALEIQLEKEARKDLEDDINRRLTTYISEQPGSLADSAELPDESRLILHDFAVRIQELADDNSALRMSMEDNSSDLRSQLYILQAQMPSRILQSDEGDSTESDAATASLQRASPQVEVMTRIIEDFDNLRKSTKADVAEIMDSVSKAMENCATCVAESAGCKKQLGQLDERSLTAIHELLEKIQALEKGNTISPPVGAPKQTVIGTYLGGWMS